MKLTTGTKWGKMCPIDMYVGQNTYHEGTLYPQLSPNLFALPDTVNQNDSEKTPM